MAFAFSDILFGALADTFGSEATFTLGSNEFTATVIDRTRGMEVGNGRFDDNLGVHTLMPIAILRVADIPTGLEPEDFEGCALLLDGVAWRVRSIEERPTSAGRADGRIFLMLARTDA